MQKIDIDTLIEIIDQQFKNNSLRNLFCTDKNQFHFSANAKKIIQTMQCPQNVLTKEEERTLLIYLEKHFLDACYAANPYINFTKDEKSEIPCIYKMLIRDIRNQLSWETIETLHFQRIRSFIKRTNASSFLMNNNSNVNAKHLVCAEYSVELQLHVLGIREESIKEPILDIGCGEHGKLIGSSSTLVGNRNDE